MKKIGLYVSSYFSALAASVIGLVFNAKWSESPMVIAVFAVLSVLPLFLLAINVLSAKRFRSKMAGFNVADMNAFLVSHRDDAENTARQKLKELRGIRNLTAVYTLFIALSAIASAVLGGILMVFGSAFYTVCLLYSGLIFYSVYSRIRRKKQLVLNETAVTVSKNDYPLIYGLARKAADCVGSTDDILILLS